MPVCNQSIIEAIEHEANTHTHTEIQMGENYLRDTFLFCQFAEHFLHTHTGTHTLVDSAINLVATTAQATRSTINNTKQRFMPSFYVFLEAFRMRRNNFIYLFY